MPNGEECKDNPHRMDYNPCHEGYYCANGDLCDMQGIDCCKRKIGLNDICNEHKDCQTGFCSDKRDVKGRFDLCRPKPKRMESYHDLPICDKDYDCPVGTYCDENCCPTEIDAKCCCGNEFDYPNIPLPAKIFTRKFLLDL